MSATEIDSDNINEVLQEEVLEDDDTNEVQDSVHFSTITTAEGIHCLKFATIFLCVCAYSGWHIIFNLASLNVAN